MHFCKPKLSPLQRRTMGLLGATLGICSALSVTLNRIEPNHFMTATNLLLALVGAAPIISTMVVLARYLTRETDEYVRTVVVRSLLWGFGLIMVADTVLGYIFAFEAVSSVHLRTLGVFNL
jgi:Na+-transporting NADH:ubiquinone oxidoreductase subunit NqrD